MSLVKTKNLYETDYYTWTQEMARLLREGRLSEIDIEHLSEEIDNLGKAEKRALKSQFERLHAHLLKWGYTNVKGHENSWKASIRGARREIVGILDENPGLKPFVSSLFNETFIGGIDWAIVETGLPPGTFPTACPWTLNQALGSDFLPVQKHDSLPSPF